MLFWREGFVDFADFSDLRVDRADDFVKAVVGGPIDVVQAADYKANVLMALHDPGAEHVGNEAQELVVVAA